MPHFSRFALCFTVVASVGISIAVADGDEDAEHLTLTSSAFEDGQAIPTKYTGEGKDISPPLAWEHAPDGTKQFVLIMDDPDAPTNEPWVHWVIYAITAETTALMEDRPRDKKLDEPKDALQGRNSWGKIGYRGPMPPKADKKHTYVFTLYALDEAIELKAGASKHVLLTAMEDHVIGKAVITGTYERE